MQSYYTIAHSVKESVTEQPQMMQHGHLKPYQVRAADKHKNPVLGHCHRVALALRNIEIEGIL